MYINGPGKWIWKGSLSHLYQAKCQTIRSRDPEQLLRSTPQFAVLVDPSKNEGKGLQVKGRVMPVGMQFVNTKLSLKFFTQTSVR